MMIYKIFRRPEWEHLDTAGETLGAPIDLSDGYIHFSTKDQATETAAKHFAGASDLVLAMIDADSLGEKLVWEPSRGGQLFPHLYRALHRAEIVQAVDLPLGPDGHKFPGDML